MKQKFSNFILFIKKLPERKHYIEFITALLSIPVLLTVILINLNNLNQSKKTNPSQSNQVEKTTIIQERITQPANEPTTANTPVQEVCKKEVGPIEIAYPKEGETITDNPVNFIINYPDKSYCSVVWSYRINLGTWSEFSSNAPVVYNLPAGPVKFELRVQSTVSNDQKILIRNFVYQVSTNTTPTATPSPTLSQTPK
jgi:hypothetical protein